MADTSTVPKLWGISGIRSAPDNDLNEADLQVAQNASPAGYKLNVRTGGAWVQDIFRRRDEFIIKPVNETRTNTATLQTDDVLRFQLLANTKYHLRVDLHFDTGTLSDFKWRHTGPESPTLVRLRRQWLAPGGSEWDGIACDVEYSQSDLVILGVGSPAGITGGVVLVEGVIHNGASSGPFAIQWAPNTAQPAEQTTVYAGSTLEFQVVQ